MVRWASPGQSKALVIFTSHIRNGMHNRFCHWFEGVGIYECIYLPVCVFICLSVRHVFPFYYGWFLYEYVIR